MKPYLLFVLTVSFGLAGCGGSKEEAPLPSAPPAPASVDIGAAVPAAAVQPTADTSLVEGGIKEEVLPQLAPVQKGIEAFKAKHGRLPNNVFEMVEAGVIAELPKLPPNKIYYMDHDKGTVHVATGP